MKKTLLATLLFGSISGLASAQNSVVLYGIVDVGYRYTKTDDAIGSKNEMTHNVSTSRFGFRGSEDLGGGLQAVFKMENGFNSGNGQDTGRLFGRDVYLGLESKDWGLVTFGRRGAASGAFDDLDPFGGSYGNAAFGNAFVAYDAPRSNNSIRYTSSSFNGFSLGLSYSLTGDANDEQPGGDNNTRAYGAMGQYKSGPLQVMITYDYIDYKKTSLDPNAYLINGAIDARAASSADFWQLGASYNFEIFKLYALYAKNDGIGRSRSYNSGTGTISLGGSNVFNPNVYSLFRDANGREHWEAESSSTDSWLIGATIPVGERGRVLVSYYAATDWDIDAINIGYKYDITKRTDIYTFFSHANNVDMGRDYSYKGSRNSVSDDVTTNQFAFGIRHKF